MNRTAILPPLLLGMVACAPALKEPPSLHEMRGDRDGATPDDVDELLRRADRLRAGRDVAAVREAAALYLQVAAADPGRTEGLVGAVRSQVWLANHLQEAEQRRAAAEAAVHAGQWCGRNDPEAACCAYWLAVALGVQARERHATGHDALPRIVELLETAAARDATLDEAGPHRVLALVLLRAPGWPTGPGDPDRGLEEARKAVRLRPEFPPNQLCLGEALEKTDDPEESEQAYQRALELARASVEAGDERAREWVQEAEKGISALGGLDR